MKKIITICLLFLSSLVFSQEFSATDGVISPQAGGFPDNARGFDFTPNANISLTSIGKRVPSGTEYIWKIWRVDNQTLIHTQNSTSTTPGVYTYEPISAPVTLLAGVRYSLILYGGFDAAYYFGTSNQINANLTYHLMRYCNGCFAGQTFPTNFLNDYHYGNPDFKFTLACITPPVLACPANVSINNDAGICGAVVSYTTPSDPCAITTQTAGLPSGATFPIGTTTNTFSATNTNGTTTCSFTVTVVDAEAPNVITQNITVPLNAMGNVTIVPTDVNNDSTDNCSILSYEFVPGAPGTVCGTVGEGGNLVLSAPIGSVFTGVNFASYGTPNGACGSFTLGGCHASNSVSIVSSYLIGQNMAIIPAINGVFGDPCGGTVKRLYVSATYGPASKTYTCANIGANNVLLKVTDVNGNSSTAPAIVTVEDTMNPTIVTLPNISVNADAGVCTYAASQLTAPTTADNCSVASVVVSPSTLVSGVNTVTWTVTDGSGNTATSIQTVTVLDTQNPTITTLSAISVNADAGVCTYASSQLALLKKPLFSPSSPITPYGSVSSAGGENYLRIIDGNVGTKFLDFNYGDGMGFTVDISSNPACANFIDITTANDFSERDPRNFEVLGSNDGVVFTSIATGLITCTGARYFTRTFAFANTNSYSYYRVNFTNQCSFENSLQVSEVQLFKLGTPTGADNCSVASIVASPASLVLGVNTVTWTVTDGSGLTATSEQTVTVIDAQNPTIATLSAINVNADAGVCTYTASQLTAPIALDNCSVVSVVVSPSILVLGANTVTWTVTDGAGLTATSTQIVTVLDTQNPTIATLSAMSVNADAGVCTYASSQLTAPIASDNCSVANVIASPSTLVLGANTVTWTVTDGSGLTATSTQIVTVLDTQNPIIATLSAMSVNADAGVCTYASSQLTAPTTADNCSVVSVIASPSTLVLGANIVTWTVTDGSGLTATSTQTVTVIDAQNPTIATLSAMSVNADAGVCTYAASQLTAPTTADNCSVVSVIASPSTLVLGANTVTWTVTDGSGLTATSTQTVTVLDTQNPTIVTLSAINVNADAGVCTYAASQLTAPTASDNCSVVSVIASPSALVLGANTVTWTVTDGSGLTVTSTQIVTVLDTQNPTIATLSAMSVNADAGVCTYAASQLTAPTAADNCSVASVVVSPSTLVLGDNTVTWTVTDGSGLTATSTQTVTVLDTQNPTIATLSAINVNADAGVCTYAASQLTAPTTADNCSVASVVVSLSILVLGDNTVTWTVTDGSGLTATSTQIVTVLDTQNPTITTLPAISVNADAGVCTYAASQLTAPTTADNCSVASVVVSPSILVLGDNTVTWTVTDGSGLTATSTQIVTVLDTQNPTIATLPAMSVNADAGVCTYASSQLAAPTASDNCSVVSVIASPSTLVLGDNTVTWTVTDGSGLTATSTQIITVLDTQNPTIATLSAMSVNADAGVCTYASSQLTAPTTADNCSVVSVIASPSTLVLGANIVTWTVTDGSGLTATSTQTVTVTDAQNPTITTLPNISVSADAGGCTYAASQLTAPTTADNCSVVSVIASPSTLVSGANTVIWIVTDGAGLTASSIQTVTVIDNEAPIVVSQNITVALDVNGQAAITPAMVNNGSTDNCGIASVSTSQNNFDCGNVGINTIILTVTDNAGNESTASVLVTVINTYGDYDADGIKDNCDDDDDNDGVLDTIDNCPLTANTDQADNDSDGLGDTCDNDDDNDGYLDTSDNCPMTYNPYQEDRDNDGFGDVCDLAEINVSQAVTPNGDGINDTWVIYNIEQYPNLSVRVFNKWGSEVFFGKNYQNDWNGSYKNNSESLPEGSYYYQIDLSGNGSLDKEGWIYINK